MNKTKMFKNALYSYHYNNGFVGVKMVKCPICNGEIKEINQETMDRFTCEYDDYCPKCDRIVGHFAYGDYQPMSDLSEKKMRKIMQKAYEKEKKKMEEEMENA